MLGKQQKSGPKQSAGSAGSSIAGNSDDVKGNLGKNSLTDTERADERKTVSQRKRKLIERIFGWSKLDRPMPPTKLRGLGRVDWFYRRTCATYNLVRMRSLIPNQVLVS